MPPALSDYLNLLRFGAAFVVFAVHANYDRLTGVLPFFWRLSGFGNDAVIVFFVLSGFVIAFVTQTREKLALDYAAARLARLWSVVLPAIVITLALDSWGLRLSPGVYDAAWYVGDGPLWRVLTSLFFVNELWFSSIRLFSNGPIWSIGYEFWYYVIFGCAVFLRGQKRLWVLAAVLLLVGPKILLLLPVWLGGVWAFRTRLAAHLSKSASIGMFFGSILVYITFRAAGGSQSLDATVEDIVGREFVVEKLMWSRYFLSSYVIGVCIAINLVAARAIASQLGDRRLPAGRPIAYLAGFTFSLYLFHFPMLQFFAAVANHLEFGDTAKLAFVLCATLMLVWLVGTWAERQKAPIRRGMLHLLGTLRGSRSSTPRH
jgi:peptidoglycan/LPS O-acetylase OafA/YrhL